MIAGVTHATVQDAIDAACAPGDTVWVSAGTWTENVVFRGMDLVLSGEEGATLNGSGCTRGRDDCATVAVELGESVEIAGLTIIGGAGSVPVDWNDGSMGGGVFVNQSTAVVRDCLVEANTVTYAGGGSGCCTAR